MVPDWVNRIPKVRGDPHEFGTLDRVRLHDCTFLCGQLTRLRQDRSEYLVNLTYVVKKGCDTQSLDLLCRQRDRLTHHPRVLGHSPRMSGCVRISGFQSCYGKLEQLLVRPVQLLVGAIQLPHNQDECGRCRCRENSELDVHLDEHKNERKCDKIKKETPEILFPNSEEVLLRISADDYSDSSRIGNEECEKRTYKAGRADRTVVDRSLRIEQPIDEGATRDRKSVLGDVKDELRSGFALQHLNKRYDRDGSDNGDPRRNEDYAGQECDESRSAFDTVRKRVRHQRAKNGEDGKSDCRVQSLAIERRRDRVEHEERPSSKRGGADDYRCSTDSQADPPASGALQFLQSQLSVPPKAAAIRPANAATKLILRHLPLISSACRSRARLPPSGGLRSYYWPYPLFSSQPRTGG